MQTKINKFLIQIAISMTAFIFVLPNLVSAVSPSEYPNGTLIRADGDPKVFVIHNNKKRWLRNEAIFESYKNSWDAIKVLPTKEVDTIPYNNLIRSDGIKVYALNDLGYKRHVFNPDIFVSYNLSWVDVADINQTELINYPDSNLIREVGNEKIYYIEGETKRWISSAEAFNANHFNWDAIQIINTVDANHYNVGIAISVNVNVTIPSVLTINGITPNRITNNTATDVMITGTNFKEGASVKIGLSYSASGIVVLNPTTITANIPANIQEGVYNLIVTNLDGDSVTSTNALTIQFLSLTVNLKANGEEGPITVQSGSSILLSWTISGNPTGCTASGDWSGSKFVSGGSENIANLTSFKTFIITCTNNSGSISDSITVNISIPVPVGSLKVSVKNPQIPQDAIRGESSFTFAEFILDASDSEEDIYVNSMDIQHIVNPASEANKVSRLTSINIGGFNPTNTTDTIQENTYPISLRIPKGTSQTIKLVGGISANAAINSTHQFGLDGTPNINARGDFSGKTIVASFEPNSGPITTIYNNGKLSIVLDPTTHTGKTAYGGATGVEITRLKFSAQYESINLDNLVLKIDGINTSYADFSKIYLYDGAQRVGEQVPTDNNRIEFFVSGFVIPKNSSKSLIIRADITNIERGESGHAVALNYSGSQNYDTHGGGQSSGWTIRCDTTVDTDQSYTYLF